MTVAATVPDRRGGGDPVTVVIAPDKFKGSLTAVQAADAIAAGILQVRPDVVVVRLPVADGGEGTVQAALTAGYRAETVTVEGPTGDPVQAVFAIQGTRAVVEMAEASGLRRLTAGLPAPLTASSYGTGQLLLAALDLGATNVVLGIGGSASTDGGAGMAQALGAQFLDNHGVPLPRGGAALARLSQINLDRLDPRLQATTVVLASDVGNPLLGERGAAVVYGPQKGATPADVAVLEAALTRFAEVVARDLGIVVADASGGGAAGGTGAGAIAFLGARVTSGIALMLDIVGFSAAASNSVLVITGEGSLDRQSLHGKTPIGVAAAAAALGIPVVALVGRLEVTEKQLADVGISEAHALLELEPDQELAQANASALLHQIAARIAANLPASAVAEGV